MRLWKVEVLDHKGNWVRRYSQTAPSVYLNERHARAAYNRLSERLGDKVRLMYTDVEWIQDEGTTA